MLAGLLMLAVVPSLALAQEPAAGFPSEPLGEQSACDWILELRRLGAPLTYQIVGATVRQAMFTRKDLKCLRRADVPPTVVDAARGRFTAAGDAAMADAEEEVARRDLANRVDIELVAVLIGPGKKGGRRWDGIGSVDPSTIQEALLLGGATAAVVPTAQVVAAGMTIVGEATEPPDVFGYAEFRGPDAPPEWSGWRLSLLPPNSPVKDTYYANFPGSPAFRGVPLQPTDSVRFTLYDADADESDLIGAFDVGYEQLVAALAIDGLAMVRVSDETGGQVLFVEVKVRRASLATPEMVGNSFQPSGP